MLNNIIYYLIFGKPLIMYAGLFVLFCFFVTLLLAYAYKKAPRQYPIKWHMRMAMFSIFVGIIHGVLGVLAFF